MNELKPVTVLITAAGNVYMPDTTACLKHNGERELRLIGADLNDDPTILSMCDAACRVPRGDDPAYADALLEICAREHVDVLLPIMSVELETLSRNRARFEAVGTKVSVSDLEPLTIANDKGKLFSWLRSRNLPCANYAVVDSLEALEEAAKALGYGEGRVCVKATHGSGSRGFRILDPRENRFDRFMHDKPTSAVISLEEMKAMLSEAPAFPSLMVMEYLPGAEYTVDLLADRGHVRIACCRKSLGMDGSIMLNSLVTNNEAVLSLCTQVAERLGLEGNIGFDVRERADGTPLIMECNPRATAGIPVFAKAGVNLPYLAVKRLLGEPFDSEKPREGTIVRKRWIEMRSRPRFSAGNGSHVKEKGNE